MSLVHQIYSSFSTNSGPSRSILIWFSKRVGKHRVVFIYTLIAIVLELTVCFVPFIMENSVAISFVGSCCGPRPRYLSWLCDPACVVAES
ncbi:hypothetical protein DFS33DRAFT_834215 [Desarmillaria ectypa]|nr:hypothetical protein DFS33DRAFT_834215 [Desarmillaria ectypa]